MADCRCNWSVPGTYACPVHDPPPTVLPTSQVDTLRREPDVLEEVGAAVRRWASWLFAPRKK